MRGTLRQLFGLFIEDGSLGFGILGVIGTAAILRSLIPDAALVSGAILLLGSLGALVASLDFHAPKFTSRCVDCPTDEPASRSSVSRY
jgi:hypothetical protein